VPSITIRAQPSARSGASIVGPCRALRAAATGAASLSSSSPPCPLTCIAARSSVVSAFDTNGALLASGPSLLTWTDTGEDSAAIPTNGATRQEGDQATGCVASPLVASVIGHAVVRWPSKGVEGHWTPLVDGSKLSLRTPGVLERPRGMVHAPAPTVGFTAFAPQTTREAFLCFCWEAGCPSPAWLYFSAYFSLPGGICGRVKYGLYRYGYPRRGRRLYYFIDLGKILVFNG
jgi:hypothetical protein